VVNRQKGKFADFDAPGIYKKSLESGERFEYYGDSGKPDETTGQGLSGKSVERTK